MSKSTRWSIDDLKNKGLVEKDGVYVPVNSLVAKGKVEKLPSYLERPYGAIYNPNSRMNRNDYSAIQAPQPKANAKVKNATKSIVDGVRFDSKLEKYLYDLLKGAQIDFEFQKVYILQDKFRYGTEAVRAITLTVDFLIPSKNMIIDSKGYANDVSPLKYKLLKNLLWTENNGLNLPKIEMPKNKLECDLLLNKILYERWIYDF